VRVNQSRKTGLILQIDGAARQGLRNAPNSGDLAVSDLDQLPGS
jgi:hypothetical protein